MQPVVIHAMKIKPVWKLEQHKCILIKTWNIAKH